MTLEKQLQDRIKKHGPLTVADYMGIALTHSEEGYYMRSDPLGTDGDFITAPEVSQIFGELVGLWLTEQWRLLEKPEAILVELGPGRGTLMADILRTTKRISGFHEAISVHLVEMSPPLKQKQWQALAGKHQRLQWHESIDELPEKPILLVANEFFDALPIRQFTRQNGIWFERKVGLQGQKLAFIHEPTNHFTLEGAADGTIYETSEAGIAVIRAIARHIAKHGGVALIDDYGYAGGTRGDTLQAVKKHEYHEVLDAPGTADLTAHVDFDALAKAARESGVDVYGPIAQGAFLGLLGAIMRAMHLCEGIPPDQQAVVMAGLSRLVSPEHMGDLFKLICLVPKQHPTPEGFSRRS